MARADTLFSGAQRRRSVSSRFGMPEAKMPPIGEPLEGSPAADAKGPIARDCYARSRERALHLELERARRVLFVCKGNVGRSPFAAQHPEQLLPGRYELRSAGFATNAGRRSPPEVIAAGLSLGVDPREHRATPLDAGLLAWVDLVLVFDEHGRAQARTPGTPDLSVHAPPRIADPYGKSEPEVRAIFHQIRDALLAALG